MDKNINFDEARQSQLPFVELLINMGYTYLSCAEVERQRDGNDSQFILTEIANKALMKINEYEHDGITHKFSEKDVADAVEELANLPLEGLIDTSKTVYNMIMPTSGGKTIKVFHGGKTESKNFKYIDFTHPENNDFHVTVEYKAAGKMSIRVDIVCFVNGIPFAMIENKKSSQDVKVALNQHVRNQNPDHCPKLFIYPQILVGTNSKDMRYGTTDTPAKFYAKWKEKGTSLDDQNTVARNLIAQAIDFEIYTQLCNDLNGSTKDHKQLLERTPTEQDRSVIALFDKTRLLDLAKNYILYDAGKKKIMRYQQYFAIKKILQRIEQTEKTSNGQRRQGGIVWHTQGSGKSLTMVMFVRALIEDPTIINPRIIIVTDRVDLDKQINGTFENAGLKKNVERATSGEDLLKHIKEKNSSIITTLVHKFHAAGKKRAGFEDTDENIFVLIDEGHRTQGGEANLEMNKVLPNACYIAFTGTPLLKNEQSANKFGSFIDKYTIDDALADEIVLPLIYEGRFVDLHQDKEEIDRLTERVTADLTDSEKKQLQKYVETKIIKDNPKRITEIAYDIERHYLERFAGTGLKAQIVAPSKYSAILFQKYFESTGKINTAIVISDENGIIDEEDDHKKTVDQYLQNIKNKYQSLKTYEDDVTRSFVANEDGIEMLIVVDKLLTGFDAPRDTVLYLAKELHDHNLLQAIARVNRIFDNPAYAKTSGFIIDYSENAENIHSAMELFGNYDQDDVHSALIDVTEKINELEQNYGELHDIFNGVAKDEEAYLQKLSEETDRRIYYDALNKFIKTFNECMTLQDFPQKFPRVDLYRIELTKYVELRKSANLRYGESTDFSEHKLALIKIMDENIKADEAEVLTKEIDITNRAEFDKAIEEIGSTKSQAEAIAAQTERTISERFESDPIFYTKFSQKISKILEEMRQKKLADIDALRQLKLIKDDVLDKKGDELPANIEKSEAAAILYRNFEDELREIIPSADAYEQIIIGLSEVIKQSTVIDWWKNFEIKRQIKNNIDDYLYDEVKVNMGFDLNSETIQMVIDSAIELAQYNTDEFNK